MTEPIEVTGRTCVGFADTLRRNGVPTSPEQTTAFYAALHGLGRVRLRDLYWAGRVVLVGERRHFPAYDAAFREFFLAQGDGDRVAIPVSTPAPRPEVDSPDPTAGTPSAQPAAPDDDRIDDARLTPSDVQVLKAKSFAAMDPADRRRAAAMIRRLDADIPRRRSRRTEPASHGRRFDARRSLRAALRADGEPVQLARRRHPDRDRNVTIIVDVSGSMAPYALALLRFAHALRHAGHPVDVFTAGIRLTRVTDALHRHSPDAALRQIARTVGDWDGGTRLGTSMRSLVDHYGGHRSLRGAVVIVCSDGLDRDDPVLLGDAMGELRRIAHRVVWLNPLKGDARYRPLQRAMAAALPHLDVFLPGHNLASLDELCAALTTLSSRRRANRSSP